MDAIILTQVEITPHMPSFMTTSSLPSKFTNLVTPLLIEELLKTLLYALTWFLFILCFVKKSSFLIHLFLCFTNLPIFKDLFVD